MVEHKQKPIGRYDGRRDAYHPADGLARPPASLNVRTAVGAVADPYEPGKRIVATINRRTDVLEDLYSKGAIEEHDYQTGRDIQKVFERAQRLSMPARNWSGGDRVDAADRHEDIIAANIDAAQDVRREHMRIVAAIGEMGARYLRLFLAEGWTFGRYAEHIGRGGKHGASSVADRFRHQLRQVAEFRAAKGRGA